MQKTALNFDWQFAKYDEKNLEGFSGKTVDLPHNAVDLPKSYFDETITHGIFSYGKTIPIDKKPHKRWFLRFEGVMSYAEVHVNNQHLKEHVGGYTSFEVELTEALINGDNFIHVKVDSNPANHPPFGNVIDYLTYSGIYREVTLIEREQSYLEHSLIDGNKQKLNMRFFMQGDTIGQNLTIEIYDKNECVMSHEITCKSAIESLSINHNLTLWTLDNPKLYTAKITLNAVEQESVRFGIRTLSVDENHFYLNDEPVFLRGLNRHQSYPYVGYAMPKTAQYDDADHLKYKLGCTMVRSSHYPPSKHFLDRCDEIGLLVFTELPGWQHIGDETWKRHALNDLRDLTMNDYNHPSVAIIGTRINESKDDHAFYTKTRDLVKSIDQTRPTGGVRFFGKSELLEDIYTLNDFSHRGINKGLAKKTTMTARTNPYLITEYNGHMFPTKAQDAEPRRIEHAIRHYNVLESAYQQNGVMGAIGWCMNDYNTHKEFGSNNGICFHGVNDINRNPKYAAAVYASQREIPYLKVLSMMHIGDRNHGELKEVWVATNLEAVDVYKNDILIGRYYPSEQYRSLPHPPVIIDDLIGSQIHDQENFKPKDAARVKKLLLKTLKNDLKMTLLMKLQLGFILFKYKLSYDDAVKLYTKYIGGWGEKHNVYRFEGINNNQTVINEYKGHNRQYHLKIETSHKSLTISDTYDVAKITVEEVNELNERSYYSDNHFTIETSDHLSVIGPSLRVLTGGIESFWVRTIKPGKATVKINSKYGEETIQYTIKKASN